jgi:hypothetical protein
MSGTWYLPAAEAIRDGPELSPEFRLAAACAVWPHSDRRTEAIRAAAGGALDWRRFLRVVTRHRVLTLTHDGLRRASLNVPAEIIREISAQTATLVQRSLAMAAAAVRLQRLFDDAGVPVLFLKGASLAMLAYGNLGLRCSKDLDLLVSPEMLSVATAIITREGYVRFDPPRNISDAQLRLLMPLRKDLSFVHEVTGHQIELHWRLFLNQHIMDETSVVPASRAVSMGETAILRTLGEEDLFTYLCVHGSLHWWNQLKWLADISALIAAPEGGAQRLNEAAKARGAGRSAAQAILLCHRLLGTPLQVALAEELLRSPKVGWLQATALKAMTAGDSERELHDIRFGTTRGSLSTFLLSQRWRYRLAELRNLLINETDVLTLPLPECLRFLYPVMRLPLWVWRHRIRGIAR